MRIFLLQVSSAAAVLFLNVFALFLLFRGHDLPGGGFIAGVASSISLLLLGLTFGVSQTLSLLNINMVSVALTGVITVSLVSVAPVFIAEHEFLEQYTWKFKGVPLFGDLSLGTPLIFDSGIFLVVLGVISKIVFSMLRSSSGFAPFQPREFLRYAAKQEEPVVMYAVPPVLNEEPADTKERDA